MQYAKEVLDFIDIVNVVLEGLNKPKIFENPDISIDELHFEHYLKLNFDKKSENYISKIVISTSGIALSTHLYNT